MVPMKSPTMLYRKGTQERIHGVHVDWIVVDEHQVNDHLDQGWFLTPTEAASGEQAFEAERRAAAERAEQERAERERRAAEEAERTAALDAREQRLAAMQEELERRFSELERVSTKKTSDKSDKPAAAEK